jgi:phosphoribosyl-AMP cyclohydrolase
MIEPTASEIRFDEDGLAPVVVQDAATGDVLMLAWMSQDALRLTRETGRAHFWSRGRQRLWRKGETSGNEQLVTEIRLNCERNSMLLLVEQIGAVCHDGYPTCYYRRLEPDDVLTVVRERVFDPATVYGAASAPLDANPADPLVQATQRQFGAYVFLRDQPLESESATSRRLRRNGETLHRRLADELSELAGVLNGQHRHADRASDLRLEASQAIYWLLLLAVREPLTWLELRPDRALATADETMSDTTMARLLRAEAARWAAVAPAGDDLAARAHETLALIAQACRTGGADPLEVVEADLADLAARPYLGLYFAGREHRDARTE